MNLSPMQRYKAQLKEARRREAEIASMTVYHKDVSPKVKWRRYRANAWRVTRNQDLSTLDGIEKRSFEGYHVDHIVSIWDGWKNGVPYQKIGHISNLRVISADENIRKNKSSIQSRLEAMISECGHS